MAFTPDTSKTKEQSTKQKLEQNVSSVSATPKTPASIQEQQTPTQEQNTQLTNNAEQQPSALSQEHYTTPEVSSDINPKNKANFLDNAINELKNKLFRQKKKQTHISQVRDELTVKIEHVMEEGLNDAYDELTQIQKQEFKIKGEETAFQIRNVLATTKMSIKKRIRKILKFLISWLNMLPGINHFFLEQEAKIKTDKIISLNERTKK